jgi:hypothetical protein
MGHRALGRGLLSLLGVFLASPCFADAISGTFTGNVATDFPSTTSGIITLANPKYPTTNPLGYLAAHGLSAGWSIQDVRMYYNKASDTMYVGVNFFGIAGDADGNGMQGTVSAANAAKGMVEFPNLGGRESVTLGFDMTLQGTPSFLAGVPQDKRQAGTGLDGFKIAAYQPTNAGLAGSYGSALTSQTGNLFFDPSAQHPGFEFSVSNFSKFPGYDPANGFGLVAYAGTPDDTLPEEGVLFPRVDAGRIPEPATVLGWSSVVLAGAMCRWARKRRQQSA